MIKIKKVTPMFNRIVTTAKKYAVDDVQIITSTSQIAGALMEYQTVIAVGSTVKGIKVGDLVKINPTRYMVKKFNEGSLNDGVLQENQTIGFKFNMIDIDDKERLMLYDSDIEYIVDEYEDVEEKKIDIIIPTKNIITE